MDPSGFVLLADFVPGIMQEIRYYSTYNFIGVEDSGIPYQLRAPVKPDNAHFPEPEVLH